MSGDVIPLVDELRSDFVIHSQLAQPTRNVQNEQLDGGWQLQGSFGSVIVWRTFSKWGIVDDPDGKDARLARDGVDLVHDRNLFRSDIQSDRWQFDRNQILITTTSGINPNKAHYSLTYTTFSELRPTPVENENLKTGSLNFPTHRLQNWVAFPLEYPIFIQKTEPVSPPIIVKKNGQIMAKEEWSWQNESSITLYQASRVGFFRMYTADNLYQTKVYLKRGLITLHVVARGELAGPELPRLGVYLDRRKIASIQVRDDQYSPYEIERFVKEGLHEIKLVFENDYFNSRTSEDRNVDLTEVSVIYRSSIMIKAPFRDRTTKYTANYYTNDWNSYMYYRQFLNEKKENQEWINFNAGRIALHQEMRNSVVLGPKDVVRFPVRVPEKAILRFGYGFDGRAERPGMRMVVKLHRAFHFPAIIFSANLTKPSVWQDATIDLSKFSGEKIRVSFEVAPAQMDDGSPFLVYVSNPTVLSQNERPGHLKYVFLISFDALRADHLSVYGYHRPTSPNIDTFARDSVVFENAMTAVTWTLPSFTSLFTSLYPPFHGVNEINDVLAPSMPTLPVLLKKAGFDTAGFVDSPFLYPFYGLARGFDTFNYRISEIEERCKPSLQWMDHATGRDEFLFVHLISPHSPYLPPERYTKQLGNHDQVTISATEQNEIENSSVTCVKLSSIRLDDLMFLYDGEIAELDDIFGQYILRLKKMGIYENSMIILMSDHGEEFMEHDGLFHGKDVFQETVHVPLIIKFPGSNPRLRGIRISDRVHLIDVMPTILRTFHIEPPKYLQGVSLIPLCLSTNAKNGKERTLFVQSANGILGILHGHYKYIYTRPNAEPLECGKHDAEEVYDLEADPGEKKNIAPVRSDLLRFFENERRKYEIQAMDYQKSMVGRAPSRTIELDPGVSEQFRALGYIQ